MEVFSVAPAHNKKNAKFFARRLSQPERKKLGHFFCCEQGPQGAMFSMFSFFFSGGSRFPQIHFCVLGQFFMVQCYCLAIVIFEIGRPL
jgi:hypothetical protein